MKKLLNALFEWARPKLPPGPVRLEASKEVEAQEDLFIDCQRSSEFDETKMEKLIALAREVKDAAHSRWDLVYLAGLAQRGSCLDLGPIKRGYSEMTRERMYGVEEFLFAYKFGDVKQQKDVREFYLTRFAKDNESCFELRRVLADFIYNVNLNGGSKESFFVDLAAGIKGVQPSPDHPKGMQIPFQPYDRFSIYMDFGPGHRLSGYHRRLVEKEKNRRYACKL